MQWQHVLFWLGHLSATVHEVSFGVQLHLLSSDHSFDH